MTKQPPRREKPQAKRISLKEQQSSKQDLLDELKETARDQLPVFVCPECGFESETERGLSRHRATHEEQKRQEHNVSVSKNLFYVVSKHAFAALAPGNQIAHEEHEQIAELAVGALKEWGVPEILSAYANTIGLVATCFMLYQREQIRVADIPGHEGERENVASEAA